MNNPTTLLAVFTCGLMMANFVLAYATIRVACSSQKLARGAEDTSKRQLRAYVHVKDAERIADTPDGMNFNIVINNFGQTPAYDVIITAKATDLSSYGRKWPFEKYPENMVDGARSILASGMQTNSHHVSRSLTNQEMDELRQGSKAIFIFGVIKYKDIFGAEHDTEFNFRYSCTSVKANGKLEICADGNKAT